MPNRPKTISYTILHAFVGPSRTKGQKTNQRFRKTKPKTFIILHLLLLLGGGTKRFFSHSPVSTATQSVRLLTSKIYATKLCEIEPRISSSKAVLFTTAPMTNHFLFSVFSYLVKSQSQKRLGITMDTFFSLKR